MPPEPATTRLVYISGMHRSGSTLLAALLGCAPDVLDIGQARLAWRAGFAWDHLCGCGVAFRACPFWQEVVRDALGSFDAADGRAMHRTMGRLTGVGSAARLRPFGGRFAAHKEELARFHNAYARLVRSAAAVSGAKVVVDSSLFPRYGMLLETNPALDVRVIHLVRDSRAVAFSWSRVKAIPRSESSSSEFPRLPAAAISIWWSTSHLLTELGVLPGGPHKRVRYEDLAAEPRTVVARLLRFAGSESPDLPDAGDGAFRPGLQHTTHGNPIRFHDGTIVVKPDDAWEREMSAGARRTVTALTWPWLLRYGYLRR